MVFGLSRSVAYSLLSVSADDALRYAMGDDVGYKTERQKSHSVSTFIINTALELVNIILSKMVKLFSVLFYLLIGDLIGTARPTRRCFKSN